MSSSSREISVLSFWMSVALAGGRLGEATLILCDGAYDRGAPCCCGCETGAACGCGVKASESARGQADSARDSEWATGIGTIGVAGGAANRLLSEATGDECGEGAAEGITGTGFVAGDFSDLGARKLFTRAMSSCG